MVQIGADCSPVRRFIDVILNPAAEAISRIRPSTQRCSKLSDNRNSYGKPEHNEEGRGIETNLGEQPADSFVRDLHPDLKADYIPANPPFNISDWSGQLLRDDVRWKFGVPAVGNANYAWIQHFIHHLAPPNGRGGGIAGFVMANGSLSSNTGGEGEIRKNVIEADLVDCIVAMPPQLFLTTGIPVCLRFISRENTGKNIKGGRRDRRGETLFINADQMGTMETRVLGVLSGLNGFPASPDNDIGRIVGVYHAWRGAKVIRRMHGRPPPSWLFARPS
jgi:type I restriction enzyme M protein